MHLGPVEIKFRCYFHPTFCVSHSKDTINLREKSSLLKLESNLLKVFHMKIKLYFPWVTFWAYDLIKFKGHVIRIVRTFAFYY